VMKEGGWRSEQRVAGVMKEGGWRSERAEGLLGRWSRLVGGVRELEGDWMMEKGGWRR
jgi:hypothetical protein